MDLAHKGLMRYLPTFARVAEETSFSAAARRLNVTPAAVSKSVRVLERGLGARLFHRSTHAVTLTADGEHLYRHVAPLLQQLDDALSGARNLPERPRGVLRVSLPVGFGKRFIVPLLAGFRRSYPDVELDLRFESHIVDQVRQRIDVSLGLRIDPNANLIGRRLCEARTFTVASPTFVRSHGQPRHPRDLGAYPCLCTRLPTSSAVMRWPYQEDGAPFVVTPEPVVTASSMDVLLELAAQGQGIAFAGWVAAPYIESGALVPLLEKYTAQLPPLKLFYSSKKNLPSKVRVFIDYVVDHFEQPVIPKIESARSARRPRK